MTIQNKIFQDRINGLSKLTDEQITVTPNQINGGICLAEAKIPIDAPKWGSEDGDSDAPPFGGGSIGLRFASTANAVSKKAPRNPMKSSSTDGIMFLNVKNNKMFIIGSMGGPFGYKLSPIVLHYANFFGLKKSDILKEFKKSRWPLKTIDDIFSDNEGRKKENKSIAQLIFPKGWTVIHPNESIPTIIRANNQKDAEKAYKTAKQNNWLKDDKNEFGFIKGMSSKQSIVEM